MLKKQFCKNGHNLSQTRVVRNDKHGTRCRLCVIQHQKERQASGRMLKSQRKYILRKRFGISLEQYETMLQQQNGGCAICGASVGRKDGWRLAVDHNHKTGKVRGLLCTNCNSGIGRFKDSAELLLKASSYLEVKTTG